MGGTLAGKRILALEHVGGWQIWLANIVYDFDDDYGKGSSFDFDDAVDVKVYGPDPGALRQYVKELAATGEEDQDLQSILEQAENEILHGQLHVIEECAAGRLRAGTY